jgi:hypothetical protein
MNIKEAKGFFQHGIIRQFRADPEPMGRGWMLVFVKNGGGDELFETALGHPRVFSSLDTLVNTVRDIGGRVPSVQISA